jgi:hypothetical protein
MTYHRTNHGIIDENGDPAPDGFYSVAWDTDLVLDGPFRKPGLAKRYCRGAGHTGEIVNGRYVPVAFVSNERGECVYNPHFGTEISAAVGGWTNSQDSDSF